MTSSLPDRLTEVLFGGAFPTFIQKAFLYRVVRDETVLMIDAIECWIYQQGIRHLGELERAHGLGGLAS